MTPTGSCFRNFRKIFFRCSSYERPIVLKKLYCEDNNLINFRKGGQNNINSWKFSKNLYLVRSGFYVVAESTQKGSSLMIRDFAIQSLKVKIFSSNLRIKSMTKSAIGNFLGYWTSTLRNRGKYIEVSPYFYGNFRNF